MKDFEKTTAIIVLFSLFSLIFPKTSYAYLDPGAGSLFLQLIVGVFVGVAFVIKIYWRKIKTFFNDIFSKKQKKNG